MQPRLTDAYLADVISSVPNMNNTGRLPSIALMHIGLETRLTNTVTVPEAITDSTGTVVGVGLGPADNGMHLYLLRPARYTISQ